MQWVLVTRGQLVLVFQQELRMGEGKRCRAEPGLVWEEGRVRILCGLPA